MPNRRNFTMKEKKAHVAAYRAGDLGIREYCTQEGAPTPSSLVRWCKLISEEGRLRRTPKKSGASLAAAARPADATATVAQLREQVATLKALLAQAWRDEADTI